MNKPGVYKSLTICSKDLVNGFYHLPQPIYAHGMKVVSAFLCNSVPNVAENDNYLFLRHMQGQTPITLKIYVPAGNYTASQLIGALKTALNSSGFGSAQWDVALDPLSNKVTISHPSWSWNFETVDLQLNRIFGFTKSVDPATSHTGNQLPNFSPLNLLHVYSNRLGTSLSDNFHTSYPHNNGIIASIHVTVPFGSFQSVYFSHNQFQEFDSRHAKHLIDNIDVSLRDEFLNEIDFRGIPWYIEVAFI